MQGEIDTNVKNQIAQFQGALRSFGSALSAAFGSVGGSVETGLSTTLTDVEAVFSDANANFLFDVGTVLTDLTSLENSVLNLFDISGVVAPSLTETATSSEYVTIATSDGSLTGTSLTSFDQSSGIASGTYNFSDSVNSAQINESNTFQSNGAGTLSQSAIFGPDTASQSTKTDESGSITNQQTTFDGITIVTPSSDPTELGDSPASAQQSAHDGIIDATAFADLTQTNAPSAQLSVLVLLPTSGYDVIVQSASDGSDQIVLGGELDTSAQQIVDFAPGGLTGDTINVSQASSGTIDVTTDIGTGDTGDITADDNVTGVSQDFAFTGPNETLEIADAITFGGTITGLDAGDTIDLTGIGTAMGAALGTNNVLTISGGTGGPVTLDLDPTQDFGTESFLIAPDGNGGTDVIADDDSASIVFIIAGPPMPMLESSVAITTSQQPSSAALPAKQ